MLRLIRHFLFTVAVIVWAGLCIYMLEKAQQVSVASYLNPLLSVFHLRADTMEFAQSAY